MENTESAVEIERVNGKLKSVKMVLPVWTRKSEEDGVFYASIPMLNLETYGKDEQDLDVAIKELVEGFIIICEKYGKGIEKELENLDWKKQREIEPTHIYFDFKPKKPVYRNILNTGNPKLLSYSA